MVSIGEARRGGKMKEMTLRKGEKGSAEVNVAENKRDACDGAKALEPEEPKAVSVMVRVRPLSTVEHTDPSIKNIVHCLHDGVVVNDLSSKLTSQYLGPRRPPTHSKHFKVDKVFHPHSSQIEVYAACKNIVAGVFLGINGSILAYGATGSGKTHTMFGGGISVAGVIYQAVQDILEEKERMESSGKLVTIHGSFLEVYNEDVFDLLSPLNPQGKRLPLKVQKDSSGHSCSGSDNNKDREEFKIKGLISLTLNTKEDFAQCVERGHANRFVASTGANAHSSRSHAILMLKVEVRDALDVSRGTVGRVCFCDLAGSERASRASNNDIRLREGGRINCSLLALGAVVQTLVQRKKFPNKVKYIPYRGSKLTRLLRDFLGGNCRTLMLFCISPSSLQYEETINTMLFAMQAKEIEVSAMRHAFKANSNEVAQKQETLIEELRQELAVARDELLRVKMSSVNSTPCLVNLSYQSSQLPADDSSVGPLLSSAKNEMYLTSTWSQQGEDATSPHGVQLLSAPLSSEGKIGCCPRTIPVREEACEMYTELEEKLKTFSVAKEALYREMREAEEANSELDVQLRKCKWKLIRFLSTNKRHGSDGTNQVEGAPVGVAGLRRAIELMEAEAAMQGGEMQRLLERMNEVDRTVASIREELLHQKQYPLLELLLENVKLRESCTEAECLAAHYHQQCRSIMNRGEEYVQALSFCVSAIRHMLSLAPNNVTIREEAQLAFIFANLSSLPTADMITVFEKTRETDYLPSTSLLESNKLLSSVESMEAHLQRVANDSAARSRTSARQCVQQRVKTQVKPSMNTSGDVRIGASSPLGESSRKPLGLKVPKSGKQELFARSYTTTALRKTTANGSSQVRQLSCPRHKSPIGNGGKKVTFTENDASNATFQQRRQMLRGYKSTVVKETKKSSSTASFSRSHTATEALLHQRNGVTKSPSSEPSFFTDHHVKKVQKKNFSESVSPHRNKNLTVVRTRSTGHLIHSKNGCQPPFDHLKSRSFHADLEKRYDKLLSEVQKWNIGSTTSPKDAHLFQNADKTLSKGSSGITKL